VVLRLASPVAIRAVSMEHASPILLDAYGKEAYASAPKNVKVFGLPPCPTQGGCDGLGFDGDARELLAAFEFNVTAGGVQTVSVNRKSQDSQDEGSCAVEASTCSAPPPIEISSTPRVFAGVVFEVQDNYGNDAYTCLYRVRVHGDIAEGTH
jgi:hypothetical protein